MYCDPNDCQGSLSELLALFIFMIDDGHDSHCLDSTVWTVGQIWEVYF